jgi:hypothetical protein
MPQRKYDFPGRSNPETPYLRSKETPHPKPRTMRPWFKRSFAHMPGCDASETASIHPSRHSQRPTISIRKSSARRFDSHFSQGTLLRRFWRAGNRQRFRWRKFRRFYRCLGPTSDPCSAEFGDELLCNICQNRAGRRDLDLPCLRS